MKNNWQKIKLRDCLLQKPDYGINAPAVEYSSSLPTYLRITDISDSGKFINDKKSSVDQNNTKRYFLDEGDLVFARTGASVGKTYLHSKNNGELVFAGFLIRVKPDPKKLNPAFLNAYTRTRKYFQWVKEQSMRSGQPGINSTQYGGLIFPLPSLPEQNRIVTVLETWDKSIDLLKKKIELKKQVKKGLMQKLLFGEVRLPGFSGEWKSVRLGDVGDFSKGKGVTKKQLVEEGVAVIRYGELYTKHNIKVKKIFSQIPKEVALNATLVEKGDILFAGSGETIDEIGKSAVYLFEDECYAGGDIIILKPTNNNSLFLSYLLNSNFMRRYLRKLGQGQSVVHIYKKDLEELVISIPGGKEQQSIVHYFETIDSEIDLLGQKLHALEQQKKFLLNNLVTGVLRTPEGMAVTTA